MPSPVTDNKFSYSLISNILFKGACFTQMACLQLQLITVLSLPFDGDITVK